MNQWSRTRKRIILAILLLAVAVLVGVPAFFVFYQKPTCNDGKQNGDEQGVDCGGACQLLCQSESVPLILKGDPRVLRLATSTFQVVAIVENANNDAEVYKAGYTMKLYEEGSTIPAKIVEGETFVPKGGTFAVFEGPISFEAGLVPSRVTLEWKESTIVWRKNPLDSPKLLSEDLLLSKLDTTPRLEAMIINNSLEPANNIDLVALLSDAEGNVFAASKTFIDTLAPGEEAKAIFTWPKPFGREAADTKIFIRLFPDRSFIR